MKNYVLNLKLSKDTIYGWTGIYFFSGKKLELSISGSGVYNPFYDFDKFLKALTFNQESTIIIDQEGFDAEIKIYKYHKEKVLISLCNWKNKKNPKRMKKFYSRLQQTKKRLFWVNKKDFIKNIQNELKKFYKNNLHINNLHINKDIDYDFYFPLRSILNPKRCNVRLREKKYTFFSTDYGLKNNSNL